jgi:uncharacterized protein (DUF2267 family)
MMDYKDLFLEGENSMSATSLEAINTTIHKTNSWLHDLMRIMDWSDRHRAYLALRASFHTLRDRLTVEETAQFGAQLPTLVRGFYYEDWNPSGKPQKERDKEQFLERIEQHFWDDASNDPEEIVRVVVSLIANRVTTGEIEDVRHMLPSEIRKLWP